MPLEENSNVAVDFGEEGLVVRSEGIRLCIPAEERYIIDCSYHGDALYDVISNLYVKFFLKVNIMKLHKNKETTRNLK